MNIKKLKQCKAALHELNSKGIIKLNDHDPAINDFLCSLGAVRLNDGFAHSKHTREEAKGTIDELICTKREKTIKWIISILTLLASVTAATVSVLEWLSK